MCKKLLFVAAFLSIASFAYGEIIIDDFEEPPYWGTPALQMVWADEGSGPSSATPTLIFGDAGQGLQAMDVDYQVAGGWQNPGDPTNYATWNYTGVGRTFDAPIDFQAGGQIKMQIRVEPGWDADLMKTNYFLIEWTGDQWGQTWIPGPAGISPFWSPYYEYPAVICPDGWNPPSNPGITPNTVLIHPSDGWVEITIHDDQWVPWGASLVSFDALNDMHLQLWSGWTDTSGASGGYKLDGTTTVWPAGPITGSVDVDNIRYIPEPATIALLGLGGLTLIRKTRNKQ